MLDGAVFFTLNGRHLGVGFPSDPGGDLARLRPAIDFDMPGATVELSLGHVGERTLMYKGDGQAVGLLQRMSFARDAAKAYARDKAR